MILEGEGSNELFLMGEGLNLPAQDDTPGKLLSGEDEPLVADEEIDPSEVADLVQDMQIHNELPNPEENQDEDENQDENNGYYSDQENSEGNPEVCDGMNKVDPNEDVLDAAPELISEDENSNDNPIDESINENVESIPKDVENHEDNDEGASVNENPDGDSRPSRSR